MSELIQKNDKRANIRWKLLGGASALALTANISSFAFAGDVDQPTVWVELGGQFSRLKDSQEIFSPDTMAGRPSMFSPSSMFQKGPIHSADESGKLIFQPQNSDWSFVASVQFGRALSARHVHQQTYPEPAKKYQNGETLTNFAHAAKFADTLSRDAEQHLILDFQVGNDVSIGLLGAKQSTSTINLGIRFAQFLSQSNVALKSDPDWHFKYYTYGNVRYVVGQPYHTNLAEFTARRSFRGVGPSVSFKSSVPFAGNGQDSELAIDWGINAAVLFGKQKTSVHHQVTGFDQTGGVFAVSHLPPRQITNQPTPVNSVRMKSATVPNIGGFAGLSFRYADAKVSLGYKADFFFGAVDGGIDVRKSEDRGFFGPFAAVSVGIGG